MTDLSGGYIGSANHARASEAIGYQRGRFLAEREAQQDYREYQEVIESWKTYSKQLEQRVAALEQAFTEERTSRNAIVERYSGVVALLRSMVPVLQHFAIGGKGKANFDVLAELRDRYEDEVNRSLAAKQIECRPEDNPTFRAKMPQTCRFITETMLKQS